MNNRMVLTSEVCIVFSLTRTSIFFFDSVFFYIVINIKKKGINIDKLTPNEIYTILWRDYNWTDKFTLLEVLYMQYKLLWDIDRDFFFKEFFEKGNDRGFLSAYYFRETSREVRVKEIIKQFNIPITKSLTDYKRGGVLEEIDEFLENNIRLLENDKDFVFKVVKTTLIEVEISYLMLDNIFTRLRSIDGWSPSKWRKFSKKKWEEKELILKSGKLKSRTFLISQKQEDYLGEIASDCINEIIKKGYDNYDQLEDIIESHLDQLEENDKRYVLNLITDKLDLSHKDVNQLEKDLVESLSGDFG